jgi:hypothetical protein
MFEKKYFLARGLLIQSIKTKTPIISWKRKTIHMYFRPEGALNPVVNPLTKKIIPNIKKPVKDREQLSFSIVPCKKYLISTKRKKQRVPYRREFRIFNITFNLFIFNLMNIWMRMRNWHVKSMAPKLIFKCNKFHYKLTC